MEHWIIDASLAAVLGYMLGSIPFGLLLCMATGKGDVRKIGSGNIGATNVLRTGSKGLAALTLLLDAGKGAAAVCLARVLFKDSTSVQTVGAFFRSTDSTVLLPPSVSDVSPELLERMTLGLEGQTYVLYPVLCAALAALVGHIYPVWLKGKGGKGVATFIGMMTALTHFVGLGVMIIWISTAAITRISSLSALVAVLAAPILAWALYGDVYAYTYVIAGALIWYKHKANIARLTSGTEPRIGEKKAAACATDGRDSAPDAPTGQ